ncbi:LysR substrate-binding domain-containing protein, partial [Mesorhizobium sp.]|uniref:LysR substrate-binding domain-containing protein n=1 Tax=Mesorhizobium sp. TaxID=1871066 RepID=UPI0025BD5D98
PELLRSFAVSHPRVRIELRVGRSAELAQALQAGQLDLAITMRQAPASTKARKVLRRSGSSTCIIR